MKFLIICTFLFLIATPVQAQIITAVDKCKQMEDDEDGFWCLIELAEKEKSLKTCNNFDTWGGGVVHCVDAVAKVKQLTAKDCADLKQYRTVCLEKLGLSEDDTGWKNDAVQTLAPCQQILTQKVKPLPTEIADYDKAVPLDKTAEGELRRTITIHVRSMKRSFFMAIQKETNEAINKNAQSREKLHEEKRVEYSNLYSTIMDTCSIAAQKANARDLEGIITQQGWRFQF